MSITWNGVNSDTIGVIVERIPNRYVPTRRFSPQQVAGRNGNILLVDKSFPNVEQEYEVYLSAEAQGLPSVARACAEWLMGPDGYCRLEDSYDTTVYREAFLLGGFDIENILNKFGRCTITFSCKPQKYLLTGDTPIEIPAGTTTTYTGDVVQFDGVTGASITSLSTTITPTQDLHGYDNPWPAGGGKNLFAGVASAITLNGVTVEPTADGEIWVHGEPDISSGYIPFQIGLAVSERALNQVVTASVNEKTVGIGFTFGSTGSLNLTLSDTVTSRTATFGSTLGPCNINVRYDVGNINKKYKVQLELGNQATSWTPYENICPISGRTGLSVWDDPKYGGTIEFNQKLPTKTLSYTGTNYTITSNNDGKFTVNVTATASQGTSVNHTSIGANAFTAGHVYAWIGNSDLIKVDLKAYAKYTDTIFKVTTASYNNITFVFDNLIAGTYEVFPQLFDLTEMFGQEKAEEILALENGNTGDGVAWVKNLFPKEYYAYNAGETTCVSAVNGDPYWKKDIDWTTQAGTVYGGTVDVVTGVLTVDRANIASYNGEVINEPWLSSMDAYAAGTTPTIGAQVVYELATPLTYQLTPQEIEALVGTNNVWSSSGDVSVTVTTPLGGIVTNPTPFEARPLLEVSGVGEITINGKSIQILESVSDFEIDCETMEAEDNSKIYCMDFPELSGGENEIVSDGSITALTVTPRWWTL